jgi:ABC-type nitrate/sulfonate/bicarbonate transport system substrate-binding protein
MKKIKYLLGGLAIGIIMIVGMCYVIRHRPTAGTANEHTITVAIAPYQDIAMIVNIQNLNLEQKYGTKVILNTMEWERIVPAIASSGETADVGFASLIEYLNKENNLNASGADPVLFIYPAYVFKGGAFVTFRPDIPVLTSDAIKNADAVKTFLSARIGAQKSSLYEMMIYSLARRAGVDPSSLKVYDTPLNNGILAAQSGSLDIAEAGLTQLTEARQRGGRTVLTMEDLGFADITGFVCKKSTLERKRADIENLIKMWFDCVHFVMSDLDHNSSNSLRYLDQKASTRYSLQQYKDALSQEAFPQSIEEANSLIISDTGKYSYRRISEDTAQYMIQVKKAVQAPAIPSFLTIQH